jgi:tRNA pseudouridine13 synthase
VTADLPLLTADLPGTGGWMVELADFQVEEIPSYAPSGAGEHCLVLIEKRDLTTQEAIRRLCDALGLDARSAGYAGLKDRRGVTRQWVSLHRADPAAVSRVELSGLKVLEVGLHQNKLRTGHLRGNRFRVLLRGAQADADAVARRVLERLESEGLPNFFGLQRFGRHGDNAERGLRLLRGQLKVRDRFQRRLLASALQSQLYNDVLAARLSERTHRRLLGGEVLQKVESGGLFVSEELDVDARRLAAGEVVITGPICGPRMMQPCPGSPALAVEERVLADHDISADDFASLGRIARGARRPLTVPVLGATVEPSSDGLWLGFALPPGAYATVLLREVTKTPWT